MSRRTLRWVIAQAVVSAITVAVASALYRNVTSTAERVVIVVGAALLLTAAAAIAWGQVAARSKDRHS